MSCIKQQEIHNILQYARNIYQEFQNIKQSFNKVLCPGGTFDYFGRSCSRIPDSHPFPHMNSTLDVLQTLTAPSTQGIKRQVRQKISCFSRMGFRSNFILLGKFSKIRLSKTRQCTLNCLQSWNLRFISINETYLGAYIIKECLSGCVRVEMF